MSLNPLLAGLPPVHPGAIIADIIGSSDFGHSKVAVAKALGINRNGLYQLLEGRNAITANMALRLSKVIGNDPDFWMRLQANYDLRVAYQATRAEIDQLQKLEPAAAAA